MSFEKKLEQAQALLRESNLDGWLLYDFRKNNPLACEFLDIPETQLLTRRIFYWIPREGEPSRVFHQIEPIGLAHLPGKAHTYRSWQDLEQIIAHLLGGASQIAMEYSPMNALPYVSMVDAGTLEMVLTQGKKRGAQESDPGFHVLSSANLLQRFTSVLSPEQLESHHYAASVVQETVSAAWEWMQQQLNEGVEVTEYSVHSFILELFETKGCMCEEGPIVAVNAHSADPHYVPSFKEHSVIHPGDFVLIDLWCKQYGVSGAIYADICRVGVLAKRASAEQAHIFALVHKAQAAALALIRERLTSGSSIEGWEVDACARAVIDEAGYGDYFTHRTGHNIYTEDHGPGAHLDNLETKDTRLILPGTCFSIEPGIYLVDAFGVRLETNVYVTDEGEVEVTGGLQNEILTFS